MTVAQLIEELQKLPSFAPVCINAGWLEDDGGVWTLAEVETVRWEGNHVEIE